MYENDLDSDLVFPVGTSWTEWSDLGGEDWVAGDLWDGNKLIFSLSSRRPD